jgi:lipopolysaccharide transport system permease protein
MSEQNYELIIEPTRGWFHIPWRDLMHYRDLLMILVRRDFISQYKQTILGPLWFIIQPLLTTLVFTVIFGQIARLGTDGVPPALFYLCGMVPWNYFSGCLTGTGAAFTTNAHLFSKVYFPRLIIPLSIVVSKFMALLVQLGLLIVFWIYFNGFTPAGAQLELGWRILWIPLILLQTAAVGLGTGLCLAALTAKYRDFTVLSGFLVQLWLYATPVIYTYSAIPEKWRIWVALNPMSGVVEMFKWSILEVGTPDAKLIGFSVTGTLVLLVVGLGFFTKVEKTVVDTI